MLDDRKPRSGHRSCWDFTADKEEECETSIFWAWPNGGLSISLPCGLDGRQENPNSVRVAVYEIGAHIFLSTCLGVVVLHVTPSDRREGM